MKSNKEIIEIDGDVEVYRDELVLCRKGSDSISIKVNKIRPMDDHELWVRFNTDKIKIFDFKPLLSAPAFIPLSDQAVFNRVYLDHGVPTWNNGEIDIAPEFLYDDGLPE